VPATLKLDRETKLILELRRGPFDVILDGQPAGSMGVVVFNKAGRTLWRTGPPPHQPS
jgi:hypothetical protein